MNERRKAAEEFIAKQEAATEGPWELFYSPEPKSQITIEVRWKGGAVIHWLGFDDSDTPPHQHKANADFCVAARNSPVARLLLEAEAEIDRLRKEINRARTEHAADVDFLERDA